MPRALHDVAGDLRVAARALRKIPLFTLIAVLTLALGVGATTAILTVIDGVLLRPLAYAGADRLVTILHNGRNPVAPANLIDWRSRTRSFSAMEAAEFWTPDQTSGDDPQQLYGLHVTAGTFRMLGATPLLGRTFRDDEQEAGTNHVVVIGYSLWQRVFAGDRAVLGKTLALNGESYTVVGVMPRTFQFAPFWATRAELWAPLPLATRATSRVGQSLRIFARLAPGVTMAQATSDVARVTAGLEREYPGTNRNVVVTPLKTQVVGNVETPLLVLFVAVAFVLLIACANVAHMLLARGSARRRELAVRTALGGTRRRLVAQMLTESGLLATIGGVLGVGLAFVAVRALVATAPSALPRVATIAIDVRVLGATVGVTALTAIAFGLLPALRATQVDVASAFRSGDRGALGGSDRGRLRAALVASEFALALVLLVSAGLMIRSFAALEHVDPGFDPHGVVAMTISTNGTPAADSTRRAEFYAEALARVRAVPGVAAASYINHLPIAGDQWGFHFRVDGRPVPKRGDEPTATYRVVFPGYFATMRLPILQGRDVTDRDRIDGERVVVVNEYMARTHWPSQNAIGQRIALDDSTWTTVVGVVKNAVQQQWSAPPSEEMYLPFAQQPSYINGRGATMTLVARVACTACSVGAITPRIRDAVRSLEPLAPISSILLMADVVADATADTTFYLALLSAFAIVAMTLAAVGIYGVMSYAVSRRSAEIGIRIALGAEPRTVLRAVVGEGLRLAMVGAAIGIVLAVALTRLMRGILFGVSATDLVTFAAVTLLLMSAAVVASLVPAFRATRIDPLDALRAS